MNARLKSLSVQFVQKRLKSDRKLPPDSVPTSNGGSNNSMLPQQLDSSQIL